MDYSTVQFPPTPEAYDNMQQIGVGDRSFVYKARCISSNEVVAVKVINVHESPICDLQLYAEHVNSLSLFHCPNILTPHCTFMVKSQLWVVMPFMYWGPLQIVTAFHSCAGLTEESMGTILREVLKGLVQLHERGHIHRDLKQSNIFIDSKRKVKISDYNLSSSFFEIQSGVDTAVPYWVAPEVVRSNFFTTKSDIWSFGILALELAYGKPPILISDEWAFKTLLLKITRRFHYSEWMKSENFSGYNFSYDFKNFVDSCLDDNPSNRPSAKDLLKHKFIRKYSTCNLYWPVDDFIGVENHFQRCRERIWRVRGQNDLIVSGWNFENYIFELQPGCPGSFRKDLNQSDEQDIKELVDESEIAEVSDGENAGYLVQIKTLFFARSRDLTGMNNLVLVVPSGSTATDCFNKIVARFPRMEEIRGCMVLAVNRDYTTESTTVVQDKDELAIMPFVKKIE